MSSPRTTAFGLWKESSDSNRGISIPHTTACPLYQPSRCSAAPRVVVARPSIAASLTGWWAGTLRAAPSAHLPRRRDGGGRHRDAEGGPLVPPAPSAQHRPRVHPRQQEAADDVGREVHVRVL